MSEQKEQYDALLQRIRNLGPITDVLRSPIMIKQIIAYSGDRHLLCAFFDIVNAELEKGRLTDDDMEFFRSGDLMDAIVNLDKTIAGARDIFPAEILDKINYVSLIKDPKTLAVSYTHPVIIDALCGKRDTTTYESARYTKDLVWWSKCGTFDTMNPEVKLVIVSELLKNGGASKAQELLEKNHGGLQSYAQKDSEVIGLDWFK